MASNDEGRQLRRSNPNTIHGKFLVTYYGWYTCPGDGEPLFPGHSGWHKWFEKPYSERGKPRFDLYPDVTDYSAEEQYSVLGLVTPGGESAKLFSSRNAATIRRHFNLMATHSIDGAFLMRMASELEVDGNPRSPIANLMRISDEVLDKLRSAAEGEGRVWAVMYDLTGVAPDRLEQTLRVDWGHLVLEKRILDSPYYLKENGRPVIGIKGIGFKSAYQNPDAVIDIIRGLRTFTPGGVYVVGVVSPHWRVPNQGDHDANPGFEAVYRELDALSPWSVGKVTDIEAVDYYDMDVKEDIRVIREWNQNSNGEKRVDYIPIAFPGWSANHLTPRSPQNEIPRHSGKFMWRQIYHYQREGANSIIGVSFDDFNTSTALMPAVNLSRLLPFEGHFMALDADGDTSLPPDWYLRICGMAGESVRGERRIATDLMPKKELDDYWANRPHYEDENPQGEGSSSGAGAGASFSRSSSYAQGTTIADAPVPNAEGSAEGPSASREPPMRSETMDMEFNEPAPPPYSLIDETAEDTASSSTSVLTAEPTSIADAQPAAVPNTADQVTPTATPQELPALPESHETTLPPIGNLSLGPSQPTAGQAVGAYTTSLNDGPSVQTEVYSMPSMGPPASPIATRPQQAASYPPAQPWTAPINTAFPRTGNESYGQVSPGGSGMPQRPASSGSGYRQQSPVRAEPGFVMPGQVSPSSPGIGGFASPDLVRQQSHRAQQAPPPVHPARGNSDNYNPGPGRASVSAAGPSYPNSGSPGNVPGALPSTQVPQGGYQVPQGGYQLNQGPPSNSLAPQFPQLRPSSTPPQSTAGFSMPAPGRPGLGPQRPSGSGSSYGAPGPSMPQPLAKPWNATLPDFVVDPARQAIDRFAGQDRRKKLESELQSAFRIGNKFFDQLRK